ncbi:MAG: hypothetical protein P1V51_16210 [Deltaproteobacteria bacterium]|nr:hypothetical protein [Deltaproteobacteria bacterium]
MKLSTKNREKLPKGWSHPAGSELLADHLVEDPRIPEIGLTFPGPDSQKAVDPDLLVLELTYAGQDAGDAAWALTIFPVPSNQKRDLQQAIEERILPALNGWLREERPPSWYLGAHHFRVKLNTGTHELGLDEG